MTTFIELIGVKADSFEHQTIKKILKDRLKISPDEVVIFLHEGTPGDFSVPLAKVFGSKAEPIGEMISSVVRVFILSGKELPLRELDKTRPF